MKAYQIDSKDSESTLTMVERPSPSAGPGELKVRVHAASLNYRDLVMLRNAKSRTEPLVPLSDGAGEVIDVGQGVDGFARGDRVIASFFPTWLSGELSDAHHARALGGGYDGVLAREIVLPSSAFVKLPEHLSYEEGATLPCAGLTAYNALFVATNVHPGDVVLVQGTGGVSIFALQLAKAAGARVVLTSSSEAKRVRARELGADHVIDYSADASWGKTAHAWTGGRGVDVVVDLGGPGTFDQSAAALRYGGTMSLLGVLTGTSGPLSTYEVLRKLLRVHGIYVGSVDMLRDFVRALGATRVRPVIDRVFSFEEARHAYDYLASGHHFGKVVVRVAS